LPASKSPAPELCPHGLRVPNSLRRHSVHSDPHPDGSQGCSAEGKGKGCYLGRGQCPSKSA
jgi:hypothetical protein